MAKFSKYIGLDVHKETIAVTAADGAGGEPRYWGEIKNRPKAVRRLLARLDRAGELTPVWVPDAAQEAPRDLSRAREDMKIHDKQPRQRPSGFLPRHGRDVAGA